MGQVVGILGASPNKDKYAHRALKALLDKGHSVVLINPRYTEIENIPCWPDLSSYSGKIDTLTLYIAPEITMEYASQILEAKPKRVIFNPGTENPALITLLEEKGIQAQIACTLVLLSTGQF